MVITDEKSTGINLKYIGTPSFFSVIFIKNTELNDLRKTVCLRTSEVSWKEFQFVMSPKLGGAWHTLSAMLLYQ